MTKLIIAATLMLGCHLNLTEFDRPDSTTGGDEMQGEIGEAPNIWKIWDHDNDEWWEYWRLKESPNWIEDSWLSRELATKAIEDSYKIEPTSIPQALNYVEFRLVRESVK
jgi:hypothetical protein